MKKRGQGEVIKYVIISVIIIFVTFFGYSVITSVREKTCNTELAQFEIDIKGFDKTVKFGSVKEFTKLVPCDVDEVYFFDLGKDINLDYLEHLPLLKDSVGSKAEKNIFLVKDNKILDSFYVGNLNIEFPNYICFLPKFQKINFFVEGKGKEVSVISGCFQPECTYIPVRPENNEAVGILNEAVGFGRKADADPADDLECVNCPDSVNDELSNFFETRENVDIFRKYEYCKEEGKTNVEIIIRPKGNARLSTFRFYESIPKECVNSLSVYVQEIIKNYEGDVSINADPLIIWTLEDIQKEERLSYVLDTFLTEECKEIIAGMGIAAAIENGVDVVVPTDIDDIIEQNTNLVLRINDITLSGANAEIEIDLFSKTEYNGDKEYLSYNFVGSSSNSVVQCGLHDGNKLLRCSSNADVESTLTVTIEVRFGDIFVQDTFTVGVTPSCGNGNLDFGEVCDVSN